MDVTFSEWLYDVSVLDSLSPFSILAVALCKVNGRRSWANVNKALCVSSLYLPELELHLGCCSCHLRQDRLFLKGNRGDRLFLKDTVTQLP